VNSVNPTATPINSAPIENTNMHQQTPELVIASQDVLLQGLGLLFELGDRTYSRVVPAPYQASVGQHYRHILEHFQCLTRGLRSREINYDARERNPGLETEVTFASIATCDVLSAIQNYSEETLARPCRVVHSVSYRATQPTSIESNLGREMAYCTGHAIHHYAIIRLICSELGFDVPTEFGFAPSTLKHMSTLNAD
jgi:hypothetical protein